MSSIDDVDSCVTGAGVTDPVIVGNASGAAATSASAATAPAPVRKRAAALLPSIPEDVLNNEALNAAITRLPSNYSFEVHKTLWRLRVCGAKKVALQLPEGLLMYACALSDIIARFGHVETVIMGDVTYGACCIDDYTARALGCDFMVHYGHSCLVPVDVSQMNTLYVFVDIGFSIGHLISSLKANFSGDARLILAGTIQFSAALQAAKKQLSDHFPYILVPQTRPLSQGEVLGCTSPQLPKEFPAPGVGAGAGAGSGCCNKKDNASSCSTSASTATDAGCCGSNKTTTTTTSSPEDGGIIDLSPEALGTASTSTSTGADAICVFIADGRFHLESLMIHNPHIAHYYKYDPYNKMLTSEGYDHDALHRVRRDAIDRAKTAKRWGVVLGTLGRQGSTTLLRRIESTLSQRGIPFTVVLLSEIFPAKLAELGHAVDAWVQIACPRLSIDWGYAFPAPLLSTYEFDVCMGDADWLPGGVYPMDYYSNSGGAWANYHHRQQKQKEQAALGTAGAVCEGDGISPETLEGGVGAGAGVVRRKGVGALAALKAKAKANREKAAAEAAAAAAVAAAAAAQT